MEGGGESYCEDASCDLLVGDRRDFLVVSVVVRIPSLGDSVQRDATIMSWRPWPSTQCPQSVQLRFGSLNKSNTSTKEERFGETRRKRRVAVERGFPMALPSWEWSTARVESEEKEVTWTKDAMNFPVTCTHSRFLNGKNHALIYEAQSHFLA